MVASVCLHKACSLVRLTLRNLGATTPKCTGGFGAHVALGRRRDARVLVFVTGTARLAQSAERKALNLVVVGSSPTVGVLQ